MSKVILPVGWFLGGRAPRPGKDENTYLMYRFGGEILLLTDDDAMMVAAAFSGMEKLIDWSVSRVDLEDLYAQGRQRLPAAEQVDSLLDRGMLVELDSEADDEALEKFMRTHQVFPTGDGMGNKDDDPDDFHVGHGSRTYVQVDGRRYMFWAISSAFRTMWDTLNHLDSDPEVGREELMDDARGVVRGLPGFIAVQCAFIDRVRDWSQ